MILPINRSRLLFLSLLLLSSSLLVPSHVAAEEIAITENGQGSTNAVQNTDTMTTSVQETNTTVITNDQVAEVNTGSNTATDNNGSVAITTGDTAVNTEIVNSANATNSTVSCCQAQGTMVFVTGNGSNSSNTQIVTTLEKQNLQVKQTAQVTNTVRGYASTGNNTASNNEGNVSITTGTVRVMQKTKTGPVNTTNITLPTTLTSETLLKLQGNASESANTGTYLTEVERNTTLESFATVINNFLSSLTTGGNTANGNQGNVTITTGSIELITDIINGPINNNTVTTECACPDKPTPTPIVPAPEKVSLQSPTIDKTTGGNDGEVASITASKLLPETGINWLLIAFIGNVMMLFLGMILRLRSGNAPGNAVVL